MLSLTRGRGFCEIVKKTGTGKPTKIFINESLDDTPELDSPVRDELLPRSFYTGLKNMNAANMLMLKRAIKTSNKNLLRHSLTLEQAYDTAMELLKDLLKKNLSLKDADNSKLQLIPHLMGVLWAI